MCQTKIARALLNLFKAFRISYFALWGFGLSHILQFARVFVTVAYFVLQAASFISLRLPGRYRFAHTSLDNPHSIHFSRFQSTGYQLFSSPAGSLGLRQTLCKPLGGKQFIVLLA
jgi:hypothetical protein